MEKLLDQAANVVAVVVPLIALIAYAITIRRNNEEARATLAEIKAALFDPITGLCNRYHQLRNRLTNLEATCRERHAHTFKRIPETEEEP